MPSLFVIQGRDQGTRFELDDASYTLGRTSANSIQLHDTEVSRAHAKIVRQGDSYLLRDLDSSNGTFVNGEQIERHALLSGDRVQCGRSMLLYTGVSDTPAEDITEKVSIVSRQQSASDSRILHSMSHSDGSQLLTPSGEESTGTWVDRARGNLEIMYRTALAISHTLDIDQLLSRIMEMIFEWVDADRGCIMLQDRDSERLVPKVRRHRRGVRSDERITISKTILDYVVENNEGVLTSNARDDDRWNPAQSIVQLGVREAICVPMQGRYDVVGVIYIDTSISPQRVIQQGAANKFTQDHLKLMIAIAHQAALAVEDTSYYKAMVQAERLAAIGQTIASLSHHIKNILQGVRGGSYLIQTGLDDHRRATEQLRQGSADDDQQRSPEKAVETIGKGWGIVEKNQERISKLVMDMLSFSKEREPDPEPSDLNVVTAEVVEIMKARAKEQDIELRYTPATHMPTLLFDAEGLHIAILNVVTNAVDACEERSQGRVQVTTQFDDSRSLATVTVTDNGSGMQAEELEKIFTIFVSKKGSRGTGLGLPVSRKIMHEHGGQITVESTPGAGSTFVLELPAITAPKQPRSSTADTIAPGQRSVATD